MAKRAFPSDKLDQYIVRFPDGMRERLKQAAAENKRSLNAEIIARLEQSLERKPPSWLKSANPMPVSPEMAHEILEAFKDFLDAHAPDVTAGRGRKKGEK